MGDELRGENLVHLNVRFSTETELKKIQDFLYEKSGQGVSFTGLVEAMANEVTIVTAVHNIKSNKGSRTAGVDKIKMDKYLQMPKDELILLIQSSFRNYRPKPAVNISKRVTARKDRWVSPLYWTGSYRSACVSLSSRSVKRDFIRKATAFAPIGHRNTQSGVSSMS